jgi:pyroglutamyl-peptidase
MLTVLVAGFGPFPGAPNNPSADLVRAIVKRRRPALAGVRIVSAVIPTSYAAIAGEFTALLRRHDPDGVLLFGLASRAKYMRVERRAVNAATGVYPDVTGAKLPTRRLIAGAPTELRTLAAAERLIHAARATGVDTRPSRDAGRYICNATLFTSLETARKTGRPKRVAFVHIPRPRKGFRDPRPSMSSLIRAGEAALVAFVADLRRG